MVACNIVLPTLGSLREIIAVKLWKWDRENLPSIVHSIRTAIAATVSLAIARLFGLPEAYWAAIATLVVMQSTLAATLLLSIERIVATAVGAVTGALLASYLGGNLLVFAAAVFVLGLLCAAFHMEKSAISLRERHARHYRAHPAFKRALDCCGSPLCRSLHRNPGSSGSPSCLAGTST